MTLLKTLSYSEPIASNGSADNIVLRNLVFDGAKIASDTVFGIDIRNHTGDIAIENCKFVNFDGLTQRCIYLNNVKNLEVRRCWFENHTTGCQVWGSVALDYAVFELNKSKDIVGNRSIGLTSMFQMVNCGECDSIYVQDNRVQNWVGKTHDHINFYGTGGTELGRAKIRRNWFKTVVLSRDADGVITTNTATNPWTNGGACVVVGDDGGSYFDVEDNICINGTNYGIQCVDENGAISHRVINNKILIEKRNEVVAGIVTQGALGLQTSSSVIECENNLIAAWRENGAGGFVANNVFASIAGVTDSPTNLYGQNAISAGLVESLLPENILL